MAPLTSTSTITPPASPPPERHTNRSGAWLGARLHTLRAQPEAGMATAEYAVVTVAACAFAGVLVALVQSDTVRSALESIITKALNQ